jgi:hypothetical protein
MRCSYNIDEIGMSWGGMELELHDRGRQELKRLASTVDSPHESS